MNKKIDGIISGQQLVDLKPKMADLNDEKLVADLTKRRFIRTIGVVGLGAFLYSLIPKKAQALVFGSGQKTRDNADILQTLAKEEEGNLASVKTSTDPFVASGGGGYIRQDSTATIAKETGGNLATITTNTDTIADALSQYKFSDEDTSSAGTVYRGYVEKAGNWFIVKETITSTSRTYRYYKGASSYSTNWTNRASLSPYDYFDTIF